MKKVAILQSNYIPWKGYFDMIAAVDEFILYDDMQYTKNDWRNRNKIKTPNGAGWLTVPVGQNINRRIRDVELSDVHWQTKHWKCLVSNYSKASYFKDVSTWLEPLYLEISHTNLSELNYRLIEAICKYLGFTTKISRSWDYTLADGKTERLVDLCAQAGGTEYVSGPAAKDYIDDTAFSHANIKLTWFEYGNYPEHPQLWGEFIHGVSVIDLLFNCGPTSPHYMKHIKS